MPHIDINNIKWITFDCYGTLVDWESGILDALLPWLKGRGIVAKGEEVLKLYAQFEPEAEHRGGFRIYKEILGEVMQAFGNHYGIALSETEQTILARSVPHWRPFPDSPAALTEIKKHFRLAIISNIDEDLIRGTVSQLGVEFDAIITAEAVGAYKPSAANFEFALKVLEVAKEQVLHAAGSLFHDVLPVHRMGWNAVWVDRRGGKGSGAVPETGEKWEGPRVGDAGGLVEMLRGLSQSQPSQ